mmetsp:Transcript_45588/g.108450  ORF Transcript_45588/g.108450 Transcript_45588/m.108450 type:complete len:146 (+) Transcript_45588:72-509(+)
MLQRVSRPACVTAQGFGFSWRWFAASASTSFRGPLQEHIETRVAEALSPVHLEVTNESHGRITDESHFHVLVVSQAFEGKRALDRHRLVSRLFTNEAGELQFHALRITARTPAQWQEDASSPAAPKCTGKGDGRGPTDLSNIGVE